MPRVKTVIILKKIRLALIIQPTVYAVNLSSVTSIFLKFHIRKKTLHFKCNKRERKKKR